MRRPLSAASRAVNIAVIGIVILALFRPAGPLGARVAAWQTENALRDSARESWDELRLANRLDSGGAVLRLVEFVDYECPICAAQQVVMDSLLSRSLISGIAVVQSPLRRYRRSVGAALAAICAGEQGRFPAMHRRLLSSQDWVSDGDWQREAVAAGVPDTAGFRVCLDSDAAKERLRADQETALRFGIRGTPAYVAPDIGRHAGSMTATQFLAVAGGGARR